MLSAPPEYLIIKKEILMYYIKGVYMEEYSWRLMLFSYTHVMLAALFSFFISFVFIFLSRWINSNKFKFELKQKITVLKSFSDVKPNLIQYVISISFHWGNYTLSFCSCFSGEKLSPHLSNQTVRMWIFIFVIFPRFSKVLWYQVPLHVWI